MADNTPRLYARALSAAPEMRVWLDAGQGDRGAVHDAREMQRLLDRPTWDVKLHLRPGGHTYAVWRPALFSAVPWAASSMPSDMPR